MIDKATIQRIKDAADIVEVVSDYVHLTRRGANYMGLCPFHNERTPSFSVNSRRNFCYCFSCHKGGSPVNFIMEKEGISYHDALLQLAKKYGIKVEERELSDEEKRERTERESLMVASEWAMRQMESDLRDTQEGRDVGLSYFYQRGLTDEAIKAYHLGYALDNGQYLTKKMLNAGFELETLRKLGLTGVSQQGHEYDKYRGRVIFPVMNPSGKVVAFGGRDLKGGPAKYINSPESILYSKSNELYGIFQAKSEMVRQDKCYLVEGYLDVIGMWQSGMQNVVASSGTALTDGQINMIHRFTSNITLIYDGDNAGIKAALRGMDMLLNHKMNVKVLLLPDGDDPDSFARKHTPEEFRQYVADHETDVIRFKMQTLLNSTSNDPQQRAAAINSICRTIAHIHDETERIVYVGECARAMGIAESVVLSAVSRSRQELMEQFKREREQKSLNRFISGEKQQGDVSNPTVVQGENPNNPKPSGPSGDTSEQTANMGQTAQIADQLQRMQTQNSMPLKPLERELLRLCVRYGYLPIMKDSETLVVEYVDEELNADGLSFSYSPYSKVFETLVALMEDFRKDLADYTLKINETIESDRQTGISEIADRGLSIDDIQREEERMEERLEDKRALLVKEYARDYPGDILASHEDTDIRSVATQLLFDKHTLSNIYAKNVTEQPEDMVAVTVPRALTVFRNELLEIRMREMMQEMEHLQQTGDEDGIRQLQLKIIKYTQVRQRVAKEIGDRIISPRLAPKKT